jgi:heme exporter protein CcmD
MSHGFFLVAAYAVTLVVIVVEVLTASARHRAARAATRAQETR